MYCFYIQTDVCNYLGMINERENKTVCSLHIVEERMLVWLQHQGTRTTNPTLPLHTPNINSVRN